MLFLPKPGHIGPEIKEYNVGDISYYYAEWPKHKIFLPKSKSHAMVVMKVNDADTAQDLFRLNGIHMADMSDIWLNPWFD